MSTRKNILVLCTANSGRSQIAHGYLNAFAGHNADVYSAGLVASSVSPLAIEVMKEDGIDISNYKSNSIDEYRSIDFDFVITVCDEVVEQCPVFPARVKIIHASFKDPASIAESGAEGKINAYRRVRDEIREFISGFVREYINISS